MSGKYAFAQAVKELRFVFCQTAEHSTGVRSFLTKAYPVMKKNNPETPILLREAAGARPAVYARYERGLESSKSLEGLSAKEIEDTITNMVKK